MGSAITEAFQRNTNVETLVLLHMRGVGAVHILQGLQSNSFLKKLHVYGFSEAASIQLQGLLVSTTSMKCFELSCATCGGENMVPYHRIADGLIRSQAVTELILDHCSFRGDGRRVLAQILQSKPNLSTLLILSTRYTLMKGHCVRTWELYFLGQALRFDLWS